VSAARGVPLAARHDLTVGHLEQIEGVDGIDGWRGPDGAIDVAEARVRWDDLAATPVWDRPPVWVHGDLHPANLVVADGRIVAVVDFGDLTAGDPATDLMVAWALLPAAERPTLRAAAGEVDDDTWRRARGWALTHAAACLANSADNPTIAGFARRGLAAVLADPDP
jgi:aminoglycoside phosphotransferase (APT) family kinase protein